MKRKGSKAGSDALVYTPHELAKKLGKTPQWVRDHATELPGAKPILPGANRYVFLRNEVDAFYGF